MKCTTIKEAINNLKSGDVIVEQADGSFYIMRQPKIIYIPENKNTEIEKYDGMVTFKMNNTKQKEQ